MKNAFKNIGLFVEIKIRSAGAEIVFLYRKGCTSLVWFGV